MQQKGSCYLQTYCVVRNKKSGDGKVLNPRRSYFESEFMSRNLESLGKRPHFYLSLGNPRADIINKFKQSIVMLRINKVLWLLQTCHITCNVPSEWFKIWAHERKGFLQKNPQIIVHPTIVSNYNCQQCQIWEEKKLIAFPVVVLLQNASVNFGHSVCGFRNRNEH